MASLYNSVPWYEKALYGFTQGIAGRPGNELNVAKEQMADTAARRQRDTIAFSDQSRVNAMLEEMRRKDDFETQRLGQHLRAIGKTDQEINQILANPILRKDMEEQIAQQYYGGQMAGGPRIAGYANIRAQAAKDVASLGQNQNAATVAGITGANLPEYTKLQQELALRDLERSRRLQTSLDTQSEMQSRIDTSNLGISLDPRVQNARLQAAYTKPDVSVGAGETRIVDPNRIPVGGSVIEGSTPSRSGYSATRNFMGETVHTPVTLPGTPASISPLDTTQSPTTGVPVPPASVYTPPPTGVPIPTGPQVQGAPPGFKRLTPNVGPLDLQYEIEDRLAAEKAAQGLTTGRTDSTTVRPNARAEYLRRAQEEQERAKAALQEKYKRE